MDVGNHTDKPIQRLAGSDYVNPDGSMKPRDDQYRFYEESQVHLATLTSAAFTYNGRLDNVESDPPQPPAGLFSVKGLTLQDFRRELRADPFYSKVLEIVNGTRHPVHKFHKQFWVDRNGLLFCHQQFDDKLRLCVPATLVNPLLQLYHDSKLGGHPGADVLYLRLREEFVFPTSMHRRIKEYVRQCRVCSTSKPNRHPLVQAPLSIPAPTALPFSDLATDFLELPPCEFKGTVYNFLQIYVCALSNAVHALPCTKELTGEEAAELFFERIFPFWGFPRTLRSDRDPRFTDEFYSRLAALSGIDLAFTTAHNPCSRAEKAVETLTIVLRCFAQWKQDRWVQDLPCALFTISDSPKLSRDGVKPFHTLYGFSPYTFKSAGAPDSSAAAQRLALREAARARAQDAIDLAADRTALKLPQRTADPLVPGDLVHVDRRALVQPGDRERPRKLAPLFSERVYRVTEVPHGHIARLDFAGDHPNAHPVINRIFLRKCTHDRCDPDGVARVEEDEVVFEVDAVLESRLPKSNDQARWKRSWLVRWRRSDKTEWLHRDRFVSPDGVITQALIDFERNRTNLFGTLEVGWRQRYQPGPTHQIVLQSDGFRSVTVRSDDTIQSIATLFNEDPVDLLEQNVFAFSRTRHANDDMTGLARFGLLDTTKLMKDSVLRLPQRAPPQPVV
eukprot:m.393970 g.393970  ORF g.393970 m.393970 type:complete len:675 (+) comp16766_c0_seq14:6668-8692(+)